MSHVLDSVFSFIIAAFVVLLLHGLMANMRSSATNQTLNTVAQTNLTGVTDVIEFDFRKMGYRLASPLDSCVKYADTSKIIIKGDFDNNGTVDSIRYYLGSTKPPANVNPRTRYLYRKFNTTERTMNTGTTRFRLSYYDSLGNQLAATPFVTRPSLIRSIKLAINLESPQPHAINVKDKTANDTLYSAASWEQMLKPRNMK